MVRRIVFAMVLLSFVWNSNAIAAASPTDPLPSWHEGSVKQSIVAFVDRVTDENSPDFVPPPERIATFDNDGTLWSEQPLYFQLIYAFDRISQLAPQHPEWQSQEPFASVLEGDIVTVLAGDKRSLLGILAVVHADMTATEFETSVGEWLETARHPRTHRAYTEMVFQPMLELLDYLRVNDFKTFIVSGGGIDFIRTFAEAVYGIPPEQVVGSSVKTEYRIRDGVPVIVKTAALNFVDDKEGKPVGIYQHIGRRPIFAAGNSDGDFEMLEWTTSGQDHCFGLLIHHTDAEREWAYDRNSPVGRLAKALDEAEARGWTRVDMQRDWKVVYPFD